MAYATKEEVKEEATLEGVSSLSDPELDRYINRAERWIRRSTGRGFDGEQDPDILEDLKTATILLVEYLWYWDQPEVKEGTLDPVESEKIGSYSYTAKRSMPGQETGISELDDILESLKPNVTGVNFFSVSGPSRVKCDEV